MANPRRPPSNQRQPVPVKTVRGLRCKLQRVRLLLQALQQGSSRHLLRPATVKASPPRAAALQCSARLLHSGFGWQPDSLAWPHS